jgi:WS/DGAT/MGAT family acyltransferase
MRQLTSLDAQFLAMESARTYGHVGALAVYDPSTAPGGTLEIEDLCRMVGERIHLLPPFRWKLVEVPFGLDLPYWIEDPDFDLDFHIRETAVPPPGDDRRLAETVARIFARPLDRTRPLWELYLIRGLPDGKAGMLTKIHHAAADGVSGAEILTVLLDLEPQGRKLEPPAERDGAAGRAPGDVGMLARGVVGLPRQPLRALRALPTTLPSVARFPGVGMLPGAPTMARAVGRMSRAVRGTPDGGVLEVRTARAPRLSFNTRISAHRKYAFASLPLEDVKAIKNKLGITVNDVVVGLCATGLRAWLSERGELPEEPLVALIPVSVRTPQERGTFGNKVSGMIVPIPTNVDDPRRRLQRAHEILRAAKEEHRALPASLMTDAGNFIPPALHTRGARVAAELMARLRTPINVVISNVPGPPVPLYCAGALLETYYPVSVVTDGVGVNITCMSYRDHVDFGIIVDERSVRDAWPLMDATRSALDELRDAICGRRRARGMVGRPT